MSTPDSQWRSVDVLPERGRMIEIVRKNRAAQDNRYPNNLALVTSFEREGENRVIIGLGERADTLEWPHGWYLEHDVIEWRYTKIKKLYRSKTEWLNVRHLSTERILYKVERRADLKGPMIQPHGVISVNLTILNSHVDDVDKAMVIVRENLDTLTKGVNIVAEYTSIESFDHDCEGCANTRELNRLALIEKSRDKIRELLTMRDSLEEAWKEVFNDHNITTYLIPWLERLVSE